MVCINFAEKIIYCTFACNENNTDHSQSYLAVYFRRRDTLLDVSWGGLAKNRERDATRDELDMDAAIVPLRHTGSGFSRLALATDAGALR